jgi:uncharacterized delta-60 repeat protein
MNRRISSTLLIMINKLILLLVIFASTASFGQPGSLDGDFDADGKVTTTIAGGDISGNAAAIQPDGKIVVAGSSSGNIMVARYYPDGSMDNSFGQDGIVTTDITLEDHASSIVIQPNGKIIIAGTAFESICVVRYNSDGSLDSGFGSGGIVIYGIGEFGSGRSVVLQPDGKILVGGSALFGNDKNFVILRYNTDGLLDTTFSFDGTVTTDFNGRNDRGGSIRVQTDGKILIAGESGDQNNFEDSDFAAARYNTDGTLDNSFGTNGKVTTDFLSGHDIGRSMVLQPDGKILIAGSHLWGEGKSDFAILRYNIDGSLDQTFNGDGRSIITIGIGWAFAYSMTLQFDGKILLAGTASNSFDDDFALARLDSTGLLDVTFGSFGIVLTDFGGDDDRGTDIVMQSDGKILVAGYTFYGFHDIALTRYLSGLNVGVVDFSSEDQNLLIYPNPLRDYATLKYTLTNDQIINIDLYDISGRLVQSIVNSERRVRGLNTEELGLDASIPSGSYVLVISNGVGSSSTKVIK